MSPSRWTLRAGAAALASAVALALAPPAATASTAGPTAPATPPSSSAATTAAPPSHSATTAAPPSSSAGPASPTAPPAEASPRSYVSRTDRPAAGAKRTSFNTTNYCGREDFSDVPPGSSFYEPISWMACEGISVGYTDNTFRKYREVTRGEVAAFLFRQVEPHYTADQTQDFSDVAVGGAYFEAISWFADAGVSVGYSDGTFRPGDAVTRGELAGFLLRLANDGTFTAPDSSPFTDMTPSSAFYRAATWLRAKGVTSGYADGSFGPAKPIVRAETAAFLMKADPLIQVGEPSGVEPAPTPGPSEPPTGGLTTEQWEQEAGANIAQWCDGVPIEAAPDGENWASYTAWSDGTKIVRVEELIHLSTVGPEYPDGTRDTLHPDHDLSVAIQYHECAHIMQYRVYDYDGAAMDEAMNRVYGNSNGTEHMADCMSDVMGAKRTGVLKEGWSYTAGYGGACTEAHLDAARKLINGQRV